MRAVFREPARARHARGIAGDWVDRGRARIRIARAASNVAQESSPGALARSGAGRPRPECRRWLFLGAAPPGPYPASVRGSRRAANFNAAPPGRARRTHPAPLPGVAPIRRTWLGGLRGGRPRAEREAYSLRAASWKASLVCRRPGPPPWDRGAHLQPGQGAGPHRAPREGRCRRRDRPESEASLRRGRGNASRVSKRRSWATRKRQSLAKM